MSLPPWAVVTPERRAHIERVVALLATWAAALRAPEAERARWVKAAWLHDALRDAPAAGELAHGPMAAERAAREGESDRGVLDAVLQQVAARRIGRVIESRWPLVRETVDFWNSLVGS